MRKSSTFEYAFALRATKFAEEILGKKFANDVVVGFASGKDTYERITADIFFMKNINIHIMQKLWELVIHFHLKIKNLRS
ncbi:hypothetical protein [Mycoplasmopsis cynos]|uniref:hypothetical protein n=1 Tax=Mycoplasmopsis cynos TaxID=171284 RepID=UPI003A5C8993